MQHVCWWCALMARRALRSAGLALLVVSFAGAAFAEEGGSEGDEGAQCRLHAELSVERQLRRLSLDLRGYAPEYEEHAAVEGKQVVPEAIIDELLDSDDFRIQMRRFHESLLWPNLDGVNLYFYRFGLVPTVLSPQTTVWSLSAGAARQAYRGGDRTHICQDKPQSELGWDAQGVPLSEAMGTDSQGPWVAEGWVELSPYWAPETTIRACAFDAQETPSYTQDGQSYPCGVRDASPGACGCGPNLRHCWHPNHDNSVVNAMREQLLLLVDDYTDGSRAYSGLITTKRTHYNGVLMHWRKYQASTLPFSRAFNDYTPDDGDFPAEAQWNDGKWYEVERKGAHSGILTLPAYTMRFPTNRARANRFRTVFTGQYFQSPDLADYENCDAGSDDLVKRCICRKCHQTLEPLAAYFGQVAKSGSALLSNFAQDYKNTTACKGGNAGPASGNFCNRFYERVPSEIDPDYILWRLRPLAYADSEHPYVQKNFDAGPRGIADWAIDSGLFARATVKNLFSFLYHREMRLDPTALPSEVALLEELSAEFAKHDNFKLLAKRLVMLPQYRRMP